MVIEKSGGKYSLYCTDCGEYFPNTANNEMRKEGFIAYSHFCNNNVDHVPPASRRPPPPPPLKKSKPVAPEAEVKARLDSAFTYHAPKGSQPQRYNKLRDRAKDLAQWISELCPDSRERELALTKLEECVMWANAAIARNETEGTDDA